METLVSLHNYPGFSKHRSGSSTRPSCLWPSITIPTPSLRLPSCLLKRTKSKLSLISAYQVWESKFLSTRKLRRFSAAGESESLCRLGTIFLRPCCGRSHVSYWGPTADKTSAASFTSETFLQKCHAHYARTPRDRLRSWRSIPPVVCIVLKVPRCPLKVLEAMDADVVGTLVIQCESSGHLFHNIWLRHFPRTKEI